MHIFIVLVLVSAGTHCLPAERTSRDLFEELFEIQTEPSETKAPEIDDQQPPRLPDLSRRRTIISSRRRNPDFKTRIFDEVVEYEFELLKKPNK